jgi:lipopolysaccharide export system permease protein
MLDVIRESDRESREARRDRTELLRNDLRVLLGLPELAPPDSGEPLRPVPGYCRWLESVERLVLPKTASAQTPAQAAATRPARVPTVRRVELSNWSLTATALDRVQDADRRAARFAVEVHKKWSISFACISFVIVGIVMALRFPRGGIGLVIGGALLVFSVHYVGLTSGESLADRGHVSPWLAMWMPNMILTVFGIIGLIMVSRESGSTRGGDFQEVLEGVRHLWRRVARLRA